MWRKLYPHEFVDSIHEIDFKKLKERGIQGIIADLDNTLVPWNNCELVPEVVEWVQQAKDEGFCVCVVSNNKSERGEDLSQQLEVPAFWRAVKPRRKTFRRALELMGLKPHQAAVVGDQVFTDVLGGNRLGLYTILVSPLDKREFIGTKCMRQVEKLVLFKHRRKRRQD